MPFCKSCGSAVEGQFCAKCGTPVAAPAAPGYNPPPPPQAPPAQQQQQYNYNQNYSQPGAVPPPPAAAGGMSDNLAGLLCYVLGLVTGILFLVLDPYNKKPFIRFHAFQSIFFHGATIVLAIVLAIFGGILTNFLPFSMIMLWSLVSMVVWLGIFVIWVFLLIKAYGGQKFKLPIIGDLAEKQAGN